MLAPRALLDSCRVFARLRRHSRGGTGVLADVRGRPVTAAAGWAGLWAEKCSIQTEKRTQDVGQRTDGTRRSKIPSVHPSFLLHVLILPFLEFVGADDVAGQLRISLLSLQLTGIAALLEEF